MTENDRAADTRPICTARSGRSRTSSSRLLSEGADSAKSAAAKLTRGRSAAHHDNRARLLGPCRRLSEIRHRAELRHSGFLDRPSISSVYGAQPEASGRATLAISQSGQEPGHRRGGGGGQGERLAGHLAHQWRRLRRSPPRATNIDIGAGPELSVAATKTFVVLDRRRLDAARAIGSADEGLLARLTSLPGELAKALACDWSPWRTKFAAGPMSAARSMCSGAARPSPSPRECALKFKETCQIHAEAYSAAEIMHGPVSIADAGFPVLALAARDAAGASVVEVADVWRGAASKYSSRPGRHRPRSTCPSPSGSHPLTDPLLLVVTFYVFIEQLARRLGLNPDQPPHLRKVTETL